jgi:bacteriorhodopsin
MSNVVSQATMMSTTAWWIAFAFTFTATVVFLALSYIRNVKPEARLIYYLVTFINGVTALAYLLLATGTGNNVNNPVGAMTSYYLRNWTISSGVITQYNGGTWGARQFFWLRYAAWAWVAPVTLVILGLVSGAHWVEIMWTFWFTVVSVAALFAASTVNAPNSVWPLFAAGVAAGFPVLIALAYTFRKTAYRVHAEIGRLYDVLGFSMIILIAGYAITWAVSEGGLVTTIDQETIIYAVLDIVTKVVFGAVLIWSREAIARYGTFLGVINTGIDFDFPIARSTYTGSAAAYVTEPSAPVTMGEHRDLAFAQLHAATKTAPTQAVGAWPEAVIGK